MAGRIAFDTTFLIDLQQERSRGDLEGLQVIASRTREATGVSGP